MPTKYDTNPLDPDFPEKARAAAAEGQATKTLNYSDPETQALPYASPTEEQTRRFAPPPTAGYSQPYTHQYNPADYQTVGFANVNQSLSRKVDKIGLPENVMTALPYLPFTIGGVAGLLILLFVPRGEAKVRFHAAQGLAAHIGILIVTTILGIVGNIANVAEVGSIIFQIVTFIMLIIFCVKAWKGKPVHIESIDALTNWLEEKIAVKQ